MKNVYKKAEDGMILKSSVLNRHLSARVLKRQKIHPFVRVGNMVRFDPAQDKWIVSGNHIPQGMYAGENVVVLQGYVDFLSGLNPQSFYYMRSDGSLVEDFTSSFNGVKVGYAINQTSMILDIEIVGVFE